MDKSFEGYGGKRPLLYLPFERLFLDPLNPRLPADAQGKSEEQLKETLKRYFYLDELAYSMAQNGYFDEEPLVAIPNNLPNEFENLSYEELKDNNNYSTFINKPETTFTIVEGNRRLCTVKLLMTGEISSFPLLGENVRADLKNLPVIVYPERKSVISYLGARHIIGVKKWDAYPKAKYIASMKETYGLTIEEIQQSLGDTTNSARKTYACYRFIELMQSEDELYDSEKAKENFSYLMLAVGQAPIKEFLGIPKKWSAVNQEDPIPSEKFPNLKLLFSWLFGEGKEKDKVIDESRDITGKLTAILRDSEATQYLIDSRDLNESYERCGGEGLLLAKYIKRASKDLSRAMPLFSNPNNYNSEVEALVQDCDRLLDSIKKIKG